MELACSGTLYQHIQAGKKVGVVDMTRGELGSRGSADLRDLEAAESSKILGLSVRENLDLGDGVFENSLENRLRIMTVIRKYQPTVILANAPADRHPDHGRASEMVKEAVFYSGLIKLETKFDGGVQAPWRPQSLFFYIQDYYDHPDFVVDVSNVMDVKMAAVKAFKSQFYDPNSSEPETPISGAGFLDFVVARAASYGRLIGVQHGEGFLKDTALAVKDLTDIG